MTSRYVNTPERLEETVKSFIVSNALIRSGSLVLAAVSGGADSMAMLSILHRLTGELDFTLAVGHFNHMLRDRSDAEMERAQVAAAAAGLNLPFHYGEADVGAGAAASGESVEAAARDARYRFLEELAGGIGARHIATGHTRSDQAETVLMRILRGAGIRGLAGIPMRRSGGVIIRPLLPLARDDTRAYCAATHTPYVDDPSNEDPRYLRNRIRLELLPLLESSYCEGVTDNLIRLTENASALLQRIRDRTDPLIESSLSREADGIWIVDLATAGFGAKPAPPRDTRGRAGTGPLDDTALIVFLGDIFEDRLDGESQLTRAHFDRLVRLVTDPLASGKMVTLPGFMVKKEYDTLRITRLSRGAGVEPARREPPAPSPPVVLGLPGRTDTPRYSITTEIIDREGVSQPALKSFRKEAYFDLQRITAPLTLRTPSPGDRMQLFGMSGTKKLSDIFVDKKIPASRRAGVPIITDRHHILWIVGIATSEITRVDTGTKAIVKITIQTV